MALALRLGIYARSVVRKQGPCIAAWRSLKTASDPGQGFAFPAPFFFLLQETEFSGRQQTLQRRQPFTEFGVQFLRGFAADASRGEEAASADSKSDSKNEDAKPNDEDDSSADERILVLESALKHVAKLGWSEAALVQGAKSHGLSPTFVSVYSRGATELVEYFMDQCNDELVERAEEKREELQRMLLRERLAAIVRMRLEMQAPYVSSWPRALSLQAQPQNALKAIQQRAHLADDIWRIAGDVSSEVVWYAKRASLSLVYSATEVYMLTDFSPGFRDTWTFLDRQISTALDLGKSAQELGQLGGTLAAAVPHIIGNFKGAGTCGAKFGQKGKEPSA